MQIDVVRTIGTVVREVSSREHNGKLARVLIATRSYATDIEDLWDALTKAERIPRWFLPISGDLRLGGHFQFQGHAGGDITECVPPKRVAVTWGMHGQVSWVTIDLAANADGSTQLRLEHVAHVPDALWTEYGPGAVGIGWDQGMLGLDRHVAGASAVEAKEAMAWLGSEEGKSFVRKSSDEWCKASIAAGADPAAARAGADKVTALYIGAGESTS